LSWRAGSLTDLHGELKELVDRFDEREVEYALCGSLAMAFYGLPRPALDIDLLVPAESMEPFREIANDRGYTIEVQPVIFADGAVEIRTFIRRDPVSRRSFTLKMLLVTPDLGRVWSKREFISWEGRRLCIVSHWGLIELKTLRRSAQDLEDIAGLRESRRALP
jgi:hypothetical protein